MKYIVGVYKLHLIIPCAMIGHLWVFFLTKRGWLHYMNLPIISGFYFLQVNGIRKKSLSYVEYIKLGKEYEVFVEKYGFIFQVQR